MKCPCGGTISLMCDDCGEPCFTETEWVGVLCLRDKIRDMKGDKGKFGYTPIQALINEKLDVLLLWLETKEKEKERKV